MKFTPRKTMKAVLFAGASILALNCGQASAVTISTVGCGGNSFCTFAQLFAGGTIQVDDKLFDNWTLENSTLDNGDTDNWQVTGIDDGGNIGLNFTNISFSAEESEPGEGDEEDVDFRYRIFVTDPTKRIISNTLNLTDSEAEISGEGTGEARARVVEELSTTNAFSGDIGEKRVFEIEPGADTFVDSLVIPSLTEVFVETRLDVDADVDIGENADVSASIDSFTTVYGQRMIGIPEPGTAAVLGLGLAGLAGLRRRKKRV